MDVQIIQSNQEYKATHSRKIQSNPQLINTSVFAARQMTPEYKNECFQMLHRIKKLQSRLSILERQYQNIKNVSERRPKKHRRRNSELQKQYKCVVESCQKKYGSITSLKLHLREKHGIRAKKQRLKEQIIALAHC